MFPRIKEKKRDIKENVWYSDIEESSGGICKNVIGCDRSTFYVNSMIFIKSFVHMYDYFTKDKFMTGLDLTCDQACAIINLIIY